MSGPRWNASFYATTQPQGIGRQEEEISHRKENNFHFVCERNKMNGLNKSLCGQRLVNIKPHNGKRVENSSALRGFP